MRNLESILDLDALTASGRTVGENLADCGGEVFRPEVIRSMDDPLQENAGLSVLKGNLAPSGAIIKPCAATKSLLKHRGKAVVFKSKEDMDARIDSPDLELDENSVLVMQGAGPRGYPGMPEVGNFKLPRRILEKGIRDMVRISDARMSGTAFGTVVLHTSPEAAVGGPLALVQDGDIINLDVEQRLLEVEISDEEMERRRAAWTPPDPVASRGYTKLYVDSVLQADQGCDFDFLVGSSGSQVPRESH